jgi:hypothetical protein
MATTTNYAWETPDDTDLVKDGAAAIRTLGSSIDTTTKALNPSTTLGDIEYRSSTANTNTRLAVGSTGNVLTVAGGVPTWAAPAPATSMTLLDSGSMSGASVTTATLSGAYKNLEVVLKNVLPATFNATLRLRFNNDTGTRYSYGIDGAYTAQPFADTNMIISNGNDNTAANGIIVFTVRDYANTTTWKTTELLTSVISETGTPTNYASYNMKNGAYNQKVAITSMTFYFNSGNITSGNYYVYGVQ